MEPELLYEENDYDYYDDYEIDYNTHNTFYSCGHSVIIQASKSLLLPILFSTMLVKTLAIKTNVSSRILSFISILVSCVTFLYLYELRMNFYFLFIILLTYRLRVSNCKRIVMASCFGHLFVGKLLLWDSDKWNSIKGMEMILIMKAISFSFDSHLKLDFLHFISYMTWTGTSYFGPWIKYTEHIESQNSKRTFVTKSASSLFVSYICLVTSSCLLSFFEFTYEYNFVFQMYFEALSFRLSNYFVCFFSQAISELSGVLTSRNLLKKVATPLNIEIPRSLIDVVTSWNLPMHEWLKQYAFKPAKVIYGTQIAILLTYFSSVLIHGLDVNIALVLISLSFYTLVEFKIRKRLSKLFSSCIEARPCKSKCQHVKNRNHPMTIFINIFFSMLNIYHLSYLGQIFFYNAATSNKSTQLIINEAFKIWNKTYFSSHVICVGFFFSLFF